MFFHVFFCIMKVNLVLYCLIILLHLIFSFLQTKSVLFPYAYISIESIDCILSSSFELKAVLLISSVNTWYFSLLNLFCVFDISLLFSYEFFMICSKIIRIKIIFSNGLFCFQVELFLNSVYNFQIQVFFLRLNFLCLWVFFIFTTIIY